MIQSSPRPSLRTRHRNTCHRPIPPFNIQLLSSAFATISITKVIMNLFTSSLLQVALLSLSTLAGISSAFSLLTMNTSGQRSPLAAQYKSILSIHRGITSSSSSQGSSNIRGGYYPRMAPPPGEPEPEVRSAVVACFVADV